ncbi:MAG: homoserine O-acetyltransferase [Flavobacteriaceae bacterium]|jgi:homoserine O-acetyltransferase|tara:strand:- start:195 stop:1166 length:972 start_codon:yes stop_codon:yes gene_type:complete
MSNKIKYISPFNYKRFDGGLQKISLSYQIFGKPIGVSPVILVNHALTGNSNVAGRNGWWNKLIGSNKIINTNKFTVVSFNIPGNGYDNIEENLIYNYKDFIAIDIAKIFSIGLKKLNIYKLYAAIGGSLGGGIVWELAILNPDLIKHIIPVASDWKSSDWLIANCFIQDSILNNSSKPLYDARIHAMTLYRTPESFNSRYSREKKDNIYSIEAWLNHHGKSLENRFKVQAYKSMNQLLKTIDITRGEDVLNELIKKITGNINIITIDSDLLFCSNENWKMYERIKKIKKNVNIFEIKSEYGHDAFLIENEQMKDILNGIFDNN